MIKFAAMRRIKKIHFIGIGGSGMSGIAEVLLNLGFSVSGSDRTASSVTQRLIVLGAEIYFTHAASNIKNVDLVVVSSAIAADNPELLAAQQLHIPTIPRALMLAELMRFHYGIAVAGTHGKTTTTSLIATILSDAQLDPTFVVGGILNSTRASARLGTGEYFVVEADESDASFNHFNPLASVVTNIDSDHLETYHGDISCLQQGFINFLQRLPFYGTAVLCYDSPLVREILPKIARPIITYGFEPGADVQLKNFKAEGLQSSFEVNFAHQDEFLPIKLNLAGQHNALNATAAAIIASKCCQINAQVIQQSLAQFTGVGRRMQCYDNIKLAGGQRVTLVDDYGHHPREIQMTLNALRAAFPTRRIFLVFQPHRYTRTQALANDFIRVFTQADQTVLMDIYAASETPIPGVTSQWLIQRAEQLYKFKIAHAADESAVIDCCDHHVQDGDILLIQGAGNIGAIPGRLRERSAII